MLSVFNGNLNINTRYTSSISNARSKAERYANQVSLAFEGSAHLPSKYYRRSARARTRPSSSTCGYLEILGERASFLTNKSQSGEHSTDFARRGQSGVKGSPYTSRLSLLLARTNERAICLLAKSCGRYWLRARFYNAADHDFRNILIRMRVGLKIRQR